MTVPGVGAITARALAAVIDPPQRFARSSSGRRSRPDAQTPSIRRGRLRRSHVALGDGALRGQLDEAAVALWSRPPGGSALQTWAEGLIKRIGDQAGILQSPLPARCRAVPHCCRCARLRAAIAGYAGRPASEHVSRNADGRDARGASLGN